MTAPGSALAHRESIEERGVDRFLTDALTRAHAKRSLVAVRLPAPRAALDTPLRVLRKGVSTAWRPPHGNGVCAHGATAELALDGAARFADFQRLSRSLFDRIEHVVHPDAPDGSARLWGGFAFAVGAASDGPWNGFGDGRFVLPRWSYEHADGRGVLTLTADFADGWDGRIAVIREELAVLLGALAQPPRVRGTAPRVVRVEPITREAWRVLIERLTDAIGRGEASKVVAARRSEVAIERDLEPLDVLRRLSARYPETWRFAFRFGGSTFLGATPERLFVKRGDRIETDALAGSIAANAADAAARLRTSAKDLREHRPVVEHLAERLAPFCTELEVPSQPQIRVLPDVMHLHTPIRGTLQPGVYASDLVAALHPTPAVGGVPGALASRLITAHEAHPRGWYAGPVGWIDARGDAELAVALRCGIVRGASAWVWAGGGIVEGSSPEAEWDESELKLRALLGALGVEPVR